MAADTVKANFLSMKPAVEFINVLDQYSFNQDLHCTYKFQDYTPQEGDRVAIYRLGWNYVKDYLVFEWAPLGEKDKEHVVVFSKRILPKNNSEMYQFCYISGENVWNGASLPFQFTVEVSPVSNQSCVLSVSSGEDVCDRSRVMLGRQDEVDKLREENEILRESLKAIVAQKNKHSSRNYDLDISELRKITSGLKEQLDRQQKEIEMLKKKIICGGEEYKKLYIEKTMVQRKYDKLKNKVEDKEKNISDIVNFDVGDLKSIPPFPFAK